MATEPTTTRRERLRAHTLAEIKQRAMTQIAEAGVEALSLNAVARAMGMSGPALYRYYASRDELLATLVADAWNDLADALEAAAAGGARRRSPEAHFRAVCAAYRGWALDQPHRYRLALETDYGSGRFSPETTLPGANRAMATLLDTVANLGPLPERRTGSVSALDKQLGQWARSRAIRPDLSPPALEMGVLTWTRLHGAVSLELAGVFESMSLDPALLHRVEVDLLLEHYARLSGP